ncbi:MAG: phosphotransferase family protein [Acidimicrobiales bacterium]
MTDKTDAALESPELMEVRPGEALDWAALEAHLRAGLPAELALPDAPMTVLQFPNGSANLTYCVRFGDLELVVRRPPFGVLAPGAHDMRREHRVLSRLWRVFPPAPRAYLFCDDHAVIGADFFVMARRKGEVVRDGLPPGLARHPDAGRRVGLAVVDAMAALHSVDPAACDLADLGKPDGFVARQVSGWRNRWDLVEGDHPSKTMVEVGQRLEASLAPPTRVSLVHNDLKLDNCMWDPADPDRVTAIFDWDMTTLGEPLVDLGTLLNYWPDPSDPPTAWRTRWEKLREIGLPTRAEVIERYAERSGVDCTHARWYEAFAQWKTAVVVQQLHMRWVRGESTDPRMETIADRVPMLAQTASDLLDSLGA